jgi:bacterioferritin
MHKKSIELLNKAVADELAAVHQYMYFHFHLDDQGYDLLSALFRRTAIQEMTHIELLAERILFLKGEVIMKASTEVSLIRDVGEMLETGRQMEENSARCYNQWANECTANNDSVSRKIFEQLVAEEEVHYSQFDNEWDKVQQFGERYLALQSLQRSQNISTGTAIVE